MKAETKTGKHVYQFGFEIRTTKVADLVVRVEAASEEEARRVAREAAERAKDMYLGSFKVFEREFSGASGEEYNGKQGDGFAHAPDLDMVSTHAGDGDGRSLCQQPEHVVKVADRPEDATCERCLDQAAYTKDPEAYTMARLARLARHE